MKLVEKHVVKCSSPMFDEIDELAFRSKNLYNRANYSIRQEFFESGNILKYEALQYFLVKGEAVLEMEKVTSCRLTPFLWRERSLGMRRFLSWL